MEALPKIPDYLILEHDVARILQDQEQHGWYFDERSAWKLESSLRAELQEIDKVLRDKHPYVFGSEFIPKRNNKTQGYVEGCPLTKLKELNTTSRDHISWILQTFYGWIPTQMTTTGNKPVIDEVILKDIGTEPATQFLRILTITKMLGMISEGANAWLKLVTKSRIHHHCSIATSTGRCAHRNPNLAQVPSDERFRELFIPTPGQVMVGADLSGIELRMLAHYLSRYDSGRYAKILLEDDIHQVNADRIGISRRAVKTVTYAFLYGAGDQKIGLSYDPQLSASAAKRKGKEIKEAFVAAIDGLSDLLDAIKKAAERGYVKALDGRKIIVDSSHKALNYLLQSGAGVVAKRWMVINQQTVKELGICANQLSFIHDEIQFECDPTHADDLCSSLVLSSLQAGEYYNLRIKVESEAKKGYSWKDTH